jgi:uncharacterized protein DUF4136
MRIATVAAVIGLAFLGAITFAQNVTYDFDRSAPFGRFKTYSWVKGTPVRDQLNDKRIVSAIDSQLAAKGFTKTADGGTADVLVAYHASFDKNLQINGFSSGYGYRFGAMRTGRATLDEVTVGTIAVDLVDASNKTIVWRGLASGEVDPRAKPEKRERNIEKAAAKLFKNYPPKP